MQGLETGERRLVAFLLRLLHLPHIVNDLAAHKLEGRIQHRCCLALGANEGIQAHEHLADGYGHIERAGHTGPPRPGTAGLLQFLQFLDVAVEPLLHRVLVEEVGQPMLLLRLALGIEHPRGLVEHQVLQFLVLFQTAHQRGLVATLLLPELEHLLGRRILGQDVATDAVGVERGGLRDGVVVAGLAHGGQGLDHQPRGVVGVFECQFGILAVSRDQGLQVDLFPAWLNLREGQRDGDALRTGQDGQIVLLAVGEALADCGDLTNQN